MLLTLKPVTRRRGLLVPRGLREYRRDREIRGLNVGGSDALRFDQRNERAGGFRVVGDSFAGGFPYVRYDKRHRGEVGRCVDAAFIQ
jgi:hypothetical protein